MSSTTSTLPAPNGSSRRPPASTSGSSQPKLDKKADRPFHRAPPAAPVTIDSPGATSIVISAKQIDRFIHAPAPAPSDMCPRRLPGADPESTNTLIKTLSHNHLSWHIFFNFKQYQNHAAHHLLCIWAMGASSSLLNTTYASHYEFQRPAFKSPGSITSDNYREHLRDDKFYTAYLEFFKSELLKRGLSECLEEYVLSRAANLAPDDQNGQHPGMLTRFITVIFHALIHVGYGAEFGLLGLSAEGLAMTAMHPPNLLLVDKAWFSDATGADQKGGTRNALEILSLVACDPRLDHIKQVDVAKMFRSILEKYGAVIGEYVKMWKVDVTSDTGISNAVEELSWVNTMIYGVGGHLSSQEFRADFVLMHLVTSSLFLPSLLANMSKLSSRRAFLLTYFTASLTCYLSRGRPPLDLRGFYKDTEHLVHQVSAPGTSPAPGTLSNPSSDLTQMPDAWLRLIQTSLDSPNTHLCKLHRALAHYSSMYGKHRKGWANGGEAEDKVGLGALDGTLFLRIATLTQNRLGWMRDGDPEQHWDANGFFEQDEPLKQALKLSKSISLPRPASRFPPAMSFNSLLPVCVCLIVILLIFTSPLPMRYDSLTFFQYPVEHE